MAAALTKDAMKEALLSQCTLTKTGWGDATRITSPGTIVVIKKDGISADLASDSTSLVNRIVNGTPEAPKGLMASLFSKHSSRTLKVGERMYVLKIDIKSDGILYELLSVDTTDLNRSGSTTETRYRTYLYFKFTRDFYLTMSPAEVEKSVDLVIPSEAELANQAPQTVALGQSSAQVEAILGKPHTIIDLATKKIFVYKDEKITFQNDKVVDVQ